MHEYRTVSLALGAGDTNDCRVTGSLGAPTPVYFPASDSRVGAPEGVKSLSSDSQPLDLGSRVKWDVDTCTCYRSGGTKSDN